MTNSLSSLPELPHPTGSSVSVMALNEAGKLKVTWVKPRLEPGQVITGYSVQYKIKGTTEYTNHSVSGSSTTSYTITNLDLGTEYRVRVASIGNLGRSDYCCDGNGKFATTYNCEFLLYLKTHLHTVRTDTYIYAMVIVAIFAMPSEILFPFLG